MRSNAKKIVTCGNDRMINRWRDLGEKGKKPPPPSLFNFFFLPHSTTNALDRLLLQIYFKLDLRGSCSV